MNVRATESVRHAWATLEGHAVNGVFPLHRYLGGGEHSGVYLTQIAGREPAEFAIKLILAPENAALADWQLSRWLTASRLDHPHLLRLLEAGRCQIEGVHYLYALTEYADQNLAQLLERRALTEEETREMLAPVLKALAFLHEKNLVQGHLKPSNILVVGDQLKLASDTVRPAGEARDPSHEFSAYDPPDASEAGWSALGDIWALGVTVCEALTCRRPARVRDGGSIVVPPDLPAAFRELVARCASRWLDDRPSVAQLEAWVRGEEGAIAPVSTLPAEATIALLEPASPASPEHISSRSPEVISPHPPEREMPSLTDTATHAVLKAVEARAADTAAIQTTEPVATRPDSPPTEAPVSHAPSQPMEPGPPAAASQPTEPSATRALSLAPEASVAHPTEPSARHVVSPEPEVSAARPLARPLEPSAPHVVSPAREASAARPVAQPTELSAPRVLSPLPEASAARPVARPLEPSAPHVVSPAREANAARPVARPTAPGATHALSPAPAASAARPVAQPTEPGDVHRALPPQAPPPIVVNGWVDTPIARPRQEAPAAADLQPTVPRPKPAAGASRRKPEEPPRSMWRALPLLVGGAAAFALVWVGMQMLGAGNVSAPLPPPSASATPASSAAGSTTQPADASPAKAAPPLSHWDADPSTRAEPRTPINDPPPGPEIHREIPEVSERAQRTIRGTVRVAVRVIVNQDGTVFAALTDVPGPSRYFERIAMDAAKKWLFAQSLTEDQRIMIVRFSFTREGTTARAVEL